MNKYNNPFGLGDDEMLYYKETSSSARDNFPSNNSINFGIDYKRALFKLLNAIDDYLNATKTHDKVMKLKRLDELSSLTKEECNL